MIWLENNIRVEKKSVHLNVFGGGLSMAWLRWGIWEGLGKLLEKSILIVETPD